MQEEQNIRYQSLEELQAKDPTFDLDKAHTFYPRYGGRIMVMVFVQEITEPIDLHYFLDGEKVFENRAKFQILYKMFGQKDIYTISTFPSLYTTREKAEEDIPLVVEKKTGWDKLPKEKVLEFVNRNREEEDEY